MANNKKKEAMIAKAIAMPSLNSYDLSYLRGTDYAPCLEILFRSEAWVELFQHRNRLCQSVLKQGSDKRIIAEGLKKDDRKAADMLLQTLYSLTKKMDTIRNSRSVTLIEYFDEFIDTKEKKELFDSFLEKLDAAVFCADIITGMLLDAKSILKQIDPETCLTEFNGINEAIKAVRDFSSLRHKNENSELYEIWEEYADKVELAVYTKFKEFMAEYTPVKDRLFKEGKIDKNSHKNKEELY